jgi:hypothetical protein
MIMFISVSLFLCLLVQENQSQVFKKIVQFNPDELQAGR